MRKNTDETTKVKMAVMAMRIPLFAAIIGSLCLVLASTACKDGVTCGPGTVKENGSCVPELVCGPGTTLDQESGECLPICEEGEYFDGDICRPVDRCAEGTYFDDVTQTCRPDGTGCAPGTTFDETHMVCRPDVTACGEGTHPDGQGSCVPNRLPEPDVYESGDLESPAHFDLPAEGEEVSLGGVIDLPSDLDGDGYPDQEWDLFVFSGQAGDHLRLRALSEGACMPGFILVSEAQDDDGYALLYRASVNPHSVENERDVYLPVDGDYFLWVSDIGPVLGAVFGAGTLPVGGEDYGYFISVERLAEPEIQPVSTLPNIHDGNLGSNGLAFFALENINTKEIIKFASEGKPLADAPNDLWSIVTIFAPDGRMVAEEWAGAVDRDAEGVLAADMDGEYLLVQDFLVSTGPAMEYRLSADLLDVIDCNLEDCVVGGLGEGEVAVYRWDTIPGDLLLFAAALPEEAGRYLRMDLLASDLHSLATCTIGEGQSCWRNWYVEEDGWNYLWIEETSGEAVDTFDLNTLLHPVTEVAPESSSGALSAVIMPPHGPPSGGLTRVEVAEGQVIFVDELWSSTHWVTPTVEFLNTQMSSMGPPVDVDSPELDSLQNYPIVWPKDGQTVFIRLVDEAADLQDAQWSFTPRDLQPVSLGELANAPISIPDAELVEGSHIAVFQMVAASGEEFNIQVQPDSGADLQPEVWVVARGWKYSENWSFSAYSNDLGRLAHASAGSPGQIVELDGTSPYNGELLILVGNIGTAGWTDTFSLSITTP